jgi:hypothetical protein
MHFFYNNTFDEGDIFCLFGIVECWDWKYHGQIGLGLLVIGQSHEMCDGLRVYLIVDWFFLH